MVSIDPYASPRRTLVEGRLYLYIQPGGKAWSYDLIIRGQPRIRRSTKTTDVAEAERIAYDALRNAESDVRRGVPLRTPPIPSLVRDYLTKRESEVAKKELSQAVYDHCEKVMNEYFLAWVKEANIENIADITDSQMEAYWQWRKEFNAKLPPTYTYKRKGKTVTGPRPKSHFETPGPKALNKEGNYLRVFFTWAVEKKIIERRMAPTVPWEDESPKVVSDEDWDDDPTSNWLHLNQYHAFRKAAVRRWKKAEQADWHNRVRWGDKQFARRQAKGPYPETWSRRRFEAFMFLQWVSLGVNTGMRPVEIRNLKWKRVVPIQMPDGTATYELRIFGKGKKRVIPVNSRAKNALDRICQNTTGKTVTEACRDRELGEREVFPNASVKRQFAACCIEADLFTIGDDGEKVPMFTPYALRHTYINYQRLYKNADPSKVALYVGNTPNVIAKCYERLSNYMIASRDGHLDL